MNQRIEAVTVNAARGATGDDARRIIRPIPFGKRLERLA
jgi:hypothetical protein